MTSQPYHSATDRPAISEDEADWRATASHSPLAAGDQDLVVMPEGTVPGPEDAVGTSQAADVSDDYPPASEPGVAAAQEDDLDGARATAAPMTTSPPTASSEAEDAASGDLLAADKRPADLGEQWHDIQAMFVDDPRGSVQRAAAAADAAVSALAELLRERQAALFPAGGASADTEQLRETLRSYRVLCQNLADVGGLQQLRP